MLPPLCSCGKRWQFETLHRLQAAKCEDPRGCAPTTTPVRLSGRTGWKHLFQHNGFDLWILWHPNGRGDKRYTAFTTPMGLYEYNRMPQGLCNSPASFMRTMLSIFGDLNFSILLCYLDDLLVFAATEEEALRRLEVVFQRLRHHNINMSPKKCHLMKSSVKFLCHIIDGNGVAVDPAKVEIISKM